MRETPWSGRGRRSGSAPPPRAVCSLAPWAILLPQLMQTKSNVSKIVRILIVGGTNRVLGEFKYLPDRTQPTLDIEFATQLPAM